MKRRQRQKQTSYNNYLEKVYTFERTRTRAPVRETEWERRIGFRPISCWFKRVSTIKQMAKERKKYRKKDVNTQHPNSCWTSTGSRYDFVTYCIVVAAVFDVCLCMCVCTFSRAFVVLFPSWFDFFFFLVLGFSWHCFIAFECLFIVGTRYGTSCLFRALLKRLIILKAHLSIRFQWLNWQMT